MPTSDSRLFLFATITPKPEHVGDCIKAVEAIMPQTLAEPGCHVFSLFKGRDGETIHLFECFEDQAALDAHYAQPYTAEVFEWYQGWLAKPVEITKLSSASALTSQQFG